MAWSPDNNTSLTKPPVSYTAFEESTLNLLLEWLAGWFDGNSHLVDNTPLQFPQAVIVVQQGDQSVDGGLINVLLHRDPLHRRRHFPQGYIGNSMVDISFFAKGFVKQSRTDGHTSKSMARTLGDLIFALTSSIEATRWLQQKGIMHFRPKPPRIINESLWSTRLVSCGMQMFYPMAGFPLNWLAMKGDDNKFYTIRYEDGQLVKAAGICSGAFAFDYLAFTGAVFRIVAGQLMKTLETVPSQMQVIQMVDQNNGQIYNVSVQGGALTKD